MLFTILFTACGKNNAQAPLTSTPLSSMQTNHPTPESSASPASAEKPLVSQSEVEVITNGVAVGDGGNN